MSGEELGLRLSTVATLAIPPSLALTINGSPGAIDENVFTREGDERPRPLPVPESRLSLESNLGFL